jgi:hypothetical protein
MALDPLEPATPPAAADRSTGEGGRGASPTRRRRIARLLTGQGLRRRTRWILRLAVGTPLVLVLALLIAMRSPLVSRALRDTLEANIGCRCSVGSAAITLRGRLVAEDVVLSVPSLSGPAGRVLSAPFAEFELDWSGLLSSGVRPVAVRLYDPVFRVSIGDDDNRLNLDRLGAGARGPADSPPPRIEIVAGRLDLGEHSTRDARYRVLRSIDVDGLLTPSDPRLPVFEVSLRELVDAPAIRAAAGRAGRRAIPPAQRQYGMQLAGRVNLASDEASLTLLNVGLHEWRPSSVPSPVRDMWARLNIQGGRISRTTFNYSRAEGIAAEVLVESVHMDALVPADRPGTGADRPLPLSDVNGRIRLSRAGLHALVTGTIDDLPCQVAIDTAGLDLNSALRCEITTGRFQVRQNPRLLPYAPETVRRNFAIFSGPTAEVDARVVIERGPPSPPTPDGEPAPFSVSGSIAFENGAARFDKFPYPVSDLGGLVRFTDQRIEILNIKGRGPTGAIVSAEGLIEPPNEEAAVRIDVLALDVPVDHVLDEALDPDQRQVLAALFNRRQYDRLVERGLVLRPADRPALEAAAAAAIAERNAAAAAGSSPQRLADADARIADLRRRLAAPACDFGGRANLFITAQSLRGKDQPFTYSVRIVFPEACMVPGAFPLPIRASGVELSLDGHELRLESGDFAGLRGGRADLAARVALKSDQSPAYQPFVHIEADDIPVDDLLVNAVPDEIGAPSLLAPHAPDAAPPAPPPALFSAKSLLTNLHLAGTVGCTADIAPGPDGRTSVDAAVRLANVFASPRTPGHPADRRDTVALAGLSGVIRISDRAIDIDSLAGLLLRTPPDSRPPDNLPADHAGRVSIGLSARSPDPDPADPARRSPPPVRLDAHVRADDLDLDAPVEDLVRLFSPAAADRIDASRARFRPDGRADALVVLSNAGRAATPDEPLVELRLLAARALGADALGGRLTIDHAGGTVAVTPGDSPRLRFENALLRVAFDGLHALDARLDGSITLGDAPRRHADPPEALDAALSGCTFESPLTRAVIDRALGPDAAPADLDPRGAFDAQLRLTRALPSSDAAPAAGTPPFAVAGSIAPRSLSLVHRGARLDFPSVSGRLTFDSAAGAGRFESLAASSEPWSLTLDGDWRRRDDRPGLQLDTALQLRARALSPDLRAALPEAVRDVLDRLRVEVAGPVSLRDARLTASIGPDDARDPLAFRGTLLFENASADFGLPVQGADGSISIAVQRPPAADGQRPEPSFDLAIAARSLSIEGLPLTDARARILSGSPPGQVLVPFCAADFFGGRLAATAVANSGPAGRDYQADLVLAGARFAPLLRALADRTPLVKPPGGSRDDDESRGRLDASLSLAGVAGDPASRHGRGSIRIAGGDVVRLPLVLPLLQVSNLLIPSADRLDYLQARFDLKGHTLAIEQVAVMSDTLSLMGAGTMSWPDLALDLRFNSRSAESRRIPLWSDLLETIRDELITTTVGGTLRDPRFGTESLKGTRRMLSGLLDPENDRAGATPDDAERAARIERQRLRDAARTDRPAVLVLPAPRRAAAATPP